MSKYAIDFDSVICQRNGVPTDNEDIFNCLPVKDAKDATEWLIEKGHNLYILTAHEPLSEVGEWLKKYNFPPLDYTHIKKSGTKAFIDDRAIRFTSWQDIRKLLE